MRPRAVQQSLASYITPAARRVFSSARPLVVLGLESSADDTCAAIVTSERKILANVVLKQHAIHESFGGIHPLHAQEAHQVNMPVAIHKALTEAGISLGELDGIAFTRGPGMYGCLSVCAGAAKALAAATGKPLLGVHHMQAHALTPFLTASPVTDSPTPEFPFLTLLLSGGHTLLLLARSISSFSILATTHDESIGASIDKVARDLEIPWALGAGSPGAALERFAFPNGLTGGPGPGSDLAGAALPPAPTFTQPFARRLAFSYAGLRSALTRLLEAEPSAAMAEARKRQIARAFSLAAFKQIEDKVVFALEKTRDEGHEPVRGLVVSGGVASNLILRERLRLRLDKAGRVDLPLIFPPPALCTDNAAMIAYVGLLRLQRGLIDPLTVMQRSKWPIDECEADFADETETTEKEQHLASAS
ncbi:glycoprotease [Rhodotorula sp. JG-1b]|nr:glycoprotease [Rhodotorula sp. JG-1b]